MALGELLRGERRAQIRDRGDQPGGQFLEGKLFAGALRAGLVEWTGHWALGLGHWERG
jgi:hypothetical protein